jgi:hypothetical protein
MKIERKKRIKQEKRNYERKDKGEKGGRRKRKGE